MFADNNMLHMIKNCLLGIYTGLGSGSHHNLDATSTAKVSLTAATLRKNSNF